MTAKKTTPEQHQQHVRSPESSIGTRYRKKKVFLGTGFRSIETRLLSVTTLLIMSIVGSIVWIWAENEQQVYRQRKQQEASLLTVTLADAWSSELSDKEWSHIRSSMELLFEHNQEVIYILVSDARLDDRIVVALPTVPEKSEFDFSGTVQQQAPGLVPVESTKTKRTLGLYPQSQIQIGSILRDIEFPKGQVRATQGDTIVEVTADMRDRANRRIGTLHVGISLGQFNRALRRIVQKAIVVGVLALSFGLAGAYLVARQMSLPLRQLQRHAAQIAAGDWQHRAEVERVDEIGELAGAFNQMSAQLQESFGTLEKMVQSFARFVPDKFIRAIASEGIENIQVGVADQRTLTILFCDIRGYTCMSELMTAQETFLFLNDYLACMGQAIEDCGGFIDKYIGDAIMALFDQETTDSALQAALAMRRALGEFNRDRIEKGLPRIEIGIGIHRGEVVMGTVGFISRMDSTVIGDAVNLASRVEGLTKSYGCPILVTETVLRGLSSPADFSLELVDAAVKVKGKNEPIAIYELRVS